VVPSHTLKRGSMLAVLGIALALLAPSAVADDAMPRKEHKEAPSVSEQVRSLESMCAVNADATKKLNAKESLYERLGGGDGIRAMVTEIVRLHARNKDFERFMGDIDQDRLIENVTQFLILGAGGPGEYKGRNMVDAHTHLKLTNADFLSAGSDVVQAMKSKGYQEREINEVICLLVSFREAVVVDSDKKV